MKTGVDLPKIKFKQYLILAFFIFILPLPIVLSTTVEEIDVSELVSKSDYIGKGIVETKYSQWENNNSKIYTYTVVDINKNYKGYDDKVVVKTLGGIVGEIGMKVPGQAIFKENEEVLLFLENNNEENIASISTNLGISENEAKSMPEYNIVGFSQGKFSIKEENGEKIVYNDESFELGLMTEQGIVKREFKSMSLEEFEKQIYSYSDKKESNFFQKIMEFISKIFSFLG